MPKANKHAEVKPSKYKTSLCQFFVKGEECPYAGRCAFAHGEHELQTESKNVELLKATGLQRLDGLFAQKEVAALRSHTQPAQSITGSFTSESLGLSASATLSSPMARPRRRTVMVSLPKHNTRSEMYQSPYSAVQHDPGYTEYGYPTLPAAQPVHRMHNNEASDAGPCASSNAHDNQYCDCRFSATCSQGQPSKYRHNPYGMTGRTAQCV
ncbi:hypothetical protein LSCM1_06823 [Leishmania martiniquensis]|uniref:C3H1-type domain-containing protein n=1 Tax=Leishmania martiniquensis TaxID=1580590 RepID=A0A836HK42_9TRYP|nr:hypothetical protein LSCM1_06823 [Leishmania martiniquensis]